MSWTKLASATGALALDSCGNASADAVGSTGATTIYTFHATQTGFATFVGLSFTVTGFVTNPVNNGTFTCVASTSTTITLSNSAGVAETISASCFGDCGQVDFSNLTVPPASIISLPTANLVNFRGAWVSNTAYAVGDIVLDGGLAFITATAEAASIVITAISTPAGVTTITFASTAEAGTNLWAGLNIHIQGFTGGNTGNNGDFTITSNTTTTAVFTNASGTSAGTSGSTVFFFNSGPGTKHTGTAVHSNIAISSSHFISYNFEVYTNSNSSLNAACPIFVRFIYGAHSGHTGPEVWMSIAVGCSTSTGQMMGNQFNGFTAAAQYTPLFSTNGPVNAGNFLYEWDFCGDASKFSFCLARNTAKTGVVVLEPAKDTNGLDLDTYFFVMTSSITPASMLSQVIFKQSAGSMNPYGASGAAETNIPTIFTVNTSAACNGVEPATPIFPCPGYTANPLLGAVCMRSGDAQDGEFINAVLYGTSHTFLVCKGVSAIAGQSVPCIRWEVA